MKRLSPTWPLLSVLAVAATAAGISLGHSAVSEINPLYYDTVQDRFHADQTALRPDWTAPQPLAAATASGEGLGTGCLGCSARGEGQYYTAPAVATYTDSWRADAERAAVAPAEPVFEQAAPDPERERVLRYASYPVTQDEVQAPVVETPVAEVSVAAAAVEVQ
jgi:hypothetical protein